jgi:hypothetical protein
MLDSILLNVRFATALSIEFVSDSISSSLLNLQSNRCHFDQSSHKNLKIQKKMKILFL